jgi:cobalt-zinc-cadmium efflux system protein
VLVLNVAFVAGLALVGWRAHSLGVAAEGVDYLADAGAVIVSLLAIRVAARHAKAPAIAAFVNAGWLLVLSATVAVGAVGRLVRAPHHVHGLAVFIASGIAAVAMTGAAFVLGGDDDETDLNMRAVLLDTIADAAAATGVALTGAIIFLADGLYWLDPAVALVISAVVIYHAARLLSHVLPELHGSRRNSGPTIPETTP